MAVHWWPARHSEASSPMETSRTAGLRALAGFTQLQYLWLGASKVSDSGLKELAALKQLELLDLDSTLVTDAGIKELTGLTQLRGLSLKGTQVTDDSLKELKVALPYCQIYRNEDGM